MSSTDTFRRYCDTLTMCRMHREMFTKSWDTTKTASNLSTTRAARSPKTAGNSLRVCRTSLNHSSRPRLVKKIMSNGKKNGRRGLKTSGRLKRRDSKICTRNILMLVLISCCKSRGLMDYDQDQSETVLWQRA